MMSVQTSVVMSIFRLRWRHQFLSLFWGEAWRAARSRGVAERGDIALGDYFKPVVPGLGRDPEPLLDLIRREPGVIEKGHGELLGCFSVSFRAQLLAQLLRINTSQLLTFPRHDTLTRSESINTSANPYENRVETFHGLFLGESAAEIAERLGASRSALQPYVNDFKDADLLVREGHGYRFTEKGRADHDVLL
jgi:hypothetical protein